MEPKPFRMADFMGKNNVLQPEQTKPNEFQIVKNVYVNDARKIRRRKGYHKVYDGNVHSLYSTGEALLFRENGDLKRLEADYSATILKTGIPGGREMRYLTVADRTFMSDGVVTGIYQGGVCRSWGLEVPKTPVISAISGFLTAGQYQLTLTFLRNDGQEGGAPSCALIELPDDSGIRIENISMSMDPTVVGVCVYLTPPNGEVPWKIGVIPNGTTAIDYTSDGRGSSPLMTQFMEAPPAGHLLAYYQGRVFIASGNVLWYTEKDYQVELISRQKAFIQWPSRITMLGAVSNGLWISTLSEAGFIMGDPTGKEVRYLSKAKYGAIEGTAKETNGPDIGSGEIVGPAWIWTTPMGICVGAADGLFKNLTDGRVVFPAAVSGVGTIKHEEDAKLYIVGLYFSNVGILTLPALQADGAGYESAPP